MNSLYAYTYILECANGQYYVGSTTDLERRLQEHQAGLGANFTRKHLPVKLVYYEEYQSVEQAFYRERQLHGWSRAKKEALIRGEFEKLPELSTSTSSAATSTSSAATSTSSAATSKNGPSTASTGSATE